MFDAPRLGGVDGAPLGQIDATITPRFVGPDTFARLPRAVDVARVDVAILGIPFDSVQQVCLTPLAYTRGTRFRPARRPAVDEVVHWDGWDADLPRPPAVSGLIAGPPRPAPT